MIGNLSKRGIKGEKGEKGDTPKITFEYDEATGKWHYFSDGILVDGEYVEKEELVKRDEVGKLARFVINFDATYAGDKTYDEIILAHTEGKEIVGLMPPVKENGRWLIKRFAVIGYNDDAISFLTCETKSMILIECSKDNVWSVEHANLVDQEVLNTAVANAITNARTGVELKTNRTSKIEQYATSAVKYPSVKGVFDFVTEIQENLTWQIITLKTEVVNHNTNYQDLCKKVSDNEGCISNLQDDVTYLSKSVVSVEIVDDVLVLKNGE